MSRGVNKAILIGHLGKDPEMHYTPNGGAVAAFSVATSESWKDKLTGEKVEKTEWHKVVAFGRLAEIVSQYLKKGSKVYIEGKLQTRKWQDKDGQDRYTTEVVARDMQMLDSRGTGDQSQPQQHPPQQQRPAQQSGAYRDGGAAGAQYPDFDDDIPF